MVTVRRDSDGTPVLVEIRCFSFIETAIPTGWRFFDFGNGSYALEPEEFAGDFWDRFHDADPNAESTFGRVMQKLDAFHA